MQPRRREEPQTDRTTDRGDRLTRQRLAPHARALDAEGEEVVTVDADGLDQGLCKFLLVRLPVDVHVARRSGTVGKAEVECEAALQQPVARSDLVEASEKPIERNALAIPGETCTVAACARTQPLLESLPERRCVPGTSRRVLLQYAIDELADAVGAVAGRGTKSARRHQPALERLSNRELDLFRLLTHGLKTRLLTPEQLDELRAQ